MNTDSLMNKLRSASQRHQLRTNQFGGFVAHLKQCMDMLDEVGVTAGHVSDDRFAFSFIGTEYQFRLCKAHRSPRSKIALERLTAVINGEQKAHLVRSFFFDRLGNIYDKADETYSELAISDITYVRVFLLALLDVAIDEVPED